MNDEGKQYETNEISANKIKPKRIKIIRILLRKDLQLLTKFGLDTQSIQRCECEYKSHSVGLLREHNLSRHKINETQENIILGYEFDMHIQNL